MEAIEKVKIMNIISNETSPISIRELVSRTNICITTVTTILDSLEAELRVRSTKKGKYLKTEYLVGKLNIIKNGSGFVNVFTSRDIYVNKSNLKNALNGDTVVVSIEDKDKYEGIILKVLSHEKNQEVGQVVTLLEEQYIKLDDTKKQHILIKIYDPLVKLVEGQKVAVKIGELVKDNVYSGEFNKVIGNVNDPGIDIISKAIMFDIEPVFPPFINEVLKSIPARVTEQELENRRDLRGELIFTIDGDDAKDLDDAVSLKKLANGHYLLGVHIADVSYYVPKDGIIDKEAYKRGTSCYLANRVIPMLPEQLSNGICSLNSGRDRLTKSCLMEIDTTGNLVNYEIVNSVINSKKRMTYIGVNEVLNHNIVDVSYQPFSDNLLLMQELSTIIRNRRIKQGSIDFNLVESKIIVDEFGIAKDITKPSRLDSEKIIEDFMIEANVTVATHVSYMNLPFVYRVHGNPDTKKISQFLTLVRVMGERIKSTPKVMQPQVIKVILQSLQSSPNSEIYTKELLKCMQKAEYSVNNIGHFGLCLDNYTHFTSPIRRYPDLMVHRALDDYNNAKFFEDETNVDRQWEYLDIASKHASIKEQNAVKCEREVNKMKSAEYMEKHIKETYKGTITSLEDYGFYVDIYNGVEGLVKLNELNRAVYDKDNFVVKDANNNEFRIGDKVEVIVRGASRETSQIDLLMVQKLENYKVFTKKNIGEFYD